MGATRTFEDFEVGQRFETGGRTATEADIRMFVGATGSTDRIHVDHDYAEAHPLVDDVVCHGTLTLAITDGLLADEIAQDAALAMNYGHDGVRYLGPVYPGDTLTATAEVTGTREKGDGWGVVVTDVEVRNGDGETVLVETHRFLVATADHPALAGE